MHEQQNLNELQISLEQELDFSFARDGYEQWLAALEMRINELIQVDLNKLIFLLYRLDIDEQRLQTLLKDNSEAGAAKIITGLIVERQLQKLDSRNRFRQRDSDIAEDEKW